MKLRIVAGHLKHRNIEITGASAQFRPTKEIVREAVAGYLHKKIDGAFVADICAGSGVFGFEMLSRGAQCVHFVDNDHVRCQSIRKYTALFNVEKKCQVFKREVRNYLRKCKQTYDIIYYDPPYDDLALTQIIPDILPYVATNGILIFERRKRKSPDYTLVLNEFNVQTRKYGDTLVDFFTYRYR